MSFCLAVVSHTFKNHAKSLPRDVHLGFILIPQHFSPLTCSGVTTFTVINLHWPPWNLYQSFRCMYQLPLLTKKCVSRPGIPHPCWMCLSYIHIKKACYRHAVLLHLSDCQWLNIPMKETDNHAPAAHLKFNHLWAIISKKCFQGLRYLICWWYQIISKQACSVSSHSFTYIYWVSCHFKHSFQPFFCTMFSVYFMVNWSSARISMS